MAVYEAPFSRDLMKVRLQSFQLGVEHPLKRVYVPPTVIKICGITNREDLEGVVALRPDAVGFVLAKSPRQVALDALSGLVATLPPGVTSFGVFVNPDEDSVARAIYHGGIDVVQLHGEEDPRFCRRFAPRVVKAIRLRDESDLDLIKAYEGCVRGFIIDAWVADQYGGTGKQVDVDLAQRAIDATRLPVILAGGLNPRNLATVLERLRPYGVDVSSGVEKAPGKKDITLCEAFVKGARSLGL